MKRSMLCLLVVLFSLNSFCQVSKKNETKTEPILGEPKIDQRVELLSIVFRLAGVPVQSVQFQEIYRCHTCTF